MKKFSQEMREVEVVDDIICNMCGESCRIDARPDSDKKYFEFVTFDFSHTGGYGGRFDEGPMGMDIEEVALCGTCAIKLLASLKHVPAVKSPGNIREVPTADGSWELATGMREELDERNRGWAEHVAKVEAKRARQKKTS